ncbi:MAG: hypothetical protein RIF32_13025 [Leptospirales bacterium]|jgi:hypothetical protein
MIQDAQTSSHADRSLAASARGVLITGLLTLALAGIMGGASAVPPFAPSELNPGFDESQAILWFELAHTADEVRAVLTPADPEADMRGAMDTLNVYDFPFMAAYSLYFLAMICFLRDLRRARGPSFFGSMFYFTTGLAFVPIILAGDIIENTQLLKLTRYGVDGIAAAIPFETILNLEIFTRMKWAAIFLACAHLGGTYLSLALAAGDRDGAGAGNGDRVATMLIAATFFATTVLGFLSIANLDLRALLQLATLAMILGWVGVLIHAGRRVFRRAE